MVIKGEGKIDEQSFQGKVIDGVTKLAKKYNIPVMAVCGDLTMNDKELKNHGIKAVQSLVNHYGSVKEAMKSAKTGIKEVTQILLSDFIQ